MNKNEYYLTNRLAIESDKISYLDTTVRVNTEEVSSWIDENFITSSKKTKNASTEPFEPVKTLKSFSKPGLRHRPIKNNYTIVQMRKISTNIQTKNLDSRLLQTIFNKRKLMGTFYHSPASRVRIQLNNKEKVIKN